MYLSLREVARFTGEGLLTCLCVYDGDCYVGCERGDEALYTVTGAGFVAVALPLDDADAAYVQELVEFDGCLWAFGWLVGLDADGEVEAAEAAVWRYDGSSWSLRAVLDGRAQHVVRWCNATAIADRIVTGAYNLGAQAGAANLAPGFAAEVVDGALSLDPETIHVRATAAHGEGTVRAYAASTSPTFRVEGPSGSDVYAGSAVSFNDAFPWGDFWYSLQPLVNWLGRVWYTTHDGDRQRLFSTDGRSARQGPSWLTASLGTYDLLTTFRNRLWMFGADTAGTPLFGVWRPPGILLGQAAGNWRVRLAREFGTDLWCLGTQGTRDVSDRRERWTISEGDPAAGPPGDRIVEAAPSSVVPAGDGLMVQLGYTAAWSGYYVAGGTYGGSTYYVKADGSSFILWMASAADLALQAVLVAAGEVSLHTLTLEWGDGLGAHLPTLEAVGVEWGRSYPTEVGLRSLALEWGDGSGGHTPVVRLLGLQWSDGHGVYRPSLQSVEVGWGKGGDQRPGLAAVTLEWGDGLGANKPTLQSLGLQWGDGLGGNRPTLASAGVQWADHGPWPPASKVRVSAFSLEWNDDGDPTADGETICWLTVTTERPVVGVRVVTSAVMEEGRDLQCLIRCDDTGAVDAWHTYQHFLTNRTVVVDAPGTDVRVGVAKPAAVPDETDLIVQFHYGE